LTEAQNSDYSKIAEAKAKHEEARKLTPEECRKMMDAYRTELEAWVKAQGLDRSYVPLIMGNPGGPRGGHGMMKGQNKWYVPNRAVNGAMDRRGLVVEGHGCLVVNVLNKTVVNRDLHSGEFYFVVFALLLFFIHMSDVKNVEVEYGLSWMSRGHSVAEVL
jgi:hypothetical protein